MNIIADENIPSVESVFESLGEVVKLPGRSIKQADLKICDVLLVRSVTQVSAKLLEDTPVRFVGTATSGIEHIDVSYLQAQNMGFSDAKGCNAWSVAEYVLSAIAYWTLQQQKPLNKTSVGIIGFGSVGKKVKQLCDVFEIKTKVYDPPLAELGHQFDSVYLAEIFQSDVITLHVPLTTNGAHPTQHMIGHNELAQLHGNQLLINTSRGDVIEEAALMSNTTVCDLILDVWQHEPAINRLLLEKTILGTAHIAGYSYQGKTRGTQQLYKACCKFFDIQPKTESNIQFPTTKRQSTKIMGKTASNILSQYDINLDNLKLKQLLVQPDLNVAEHFDALRKNYPIRHEWHQSIL